MRRKIENLTSEYLEINKGDTEQLKASFLLMKHGNKEGGGMPSLSK